MQSLRKTWNYYSIGEDCEYFFLHLQPQVHLVLDLTLLGLKGVTKWSIVVGSWKISFKTNQVPGWGVWSRISLAGDEFLLSHMKISELAKEFCAQTQIFLKLYSYALSNVLYKLFFWLFWCIVEMGPDPTRAYFWTAINKRPTCLWPGYFPTQPEEIFFDPKGKNLTFLGEIFRIQTQTINGWPNPSHIKLTRPYPESKKFDPGRVCHLWVWKILLKTKFSIFCGAGPWLASL